MGNPVVRRISLGFHLWSLFDTTETTEKTMETYANKGIGAVFSENPVQ